MAFFICPSSLLLDFGTIQRHWLFADKTLMLAQSYFAHDEFELYGALVKDLSQGDFMDSSIRILTYKRDGNSWSLLEEFYPASLEESGDYFQKMIKEYFAVAMDFSESIIGMHGQQLCALMKWESEGAVTQEFEDLCPNEEFKAYQNKELEKSVEFLKKALSGE